MSPGGAIAQGVHLIISTIVLHKQPLHQQLLLIYKLVPEATSTHSTQDHCVGQSTSHTIAFIFGDLKQATRVRNPSTIAFLGGALKPSVRKLD
jgi:hypothetical protein